jgi:hypothetical protein
MGNYQYGGTSVTDDPWQAVRNVIAHAIEGIVALVGALALIVIVGMVIESRVAYVEDHERCLKQATNGYEIEQCH